MDTRGRLKDIGISFPERTAVITFEVTASPEDIEKYRDMELSVSFKKFREKRSLSANAYYWVLISKTAAALHISASRLHNMLLRRVSIPAIMGGKIVTVQIPDTDEAEEEALESPTFHLKPTTNVFQNSKGTTYRAYIVLEGSHTMDSKQFSVLLDYLIEEAKEQGVEVATPDEIARMKAELNDTSGR